MPDESLARFLDQVSAHSGLRVENDLGHGFVRLRVSEAERRQAKQDIRCVEDAVIELLRNARDAHARMVFLASARSGAQRRLVVVDNGDGIPAELRELVFEPRVTSKLDSFSSDDWGVHGRGMALYSIKENAQEAFVAHSVQGQGTALSVLFDASQLSERADQSTLPTLLKNADGSWCVGPGPHNVAKAAAEFALASREACTVYMGSPVEIAATLYAYGKHVRKGADPHAGMPFEELSPCEALAHVEDAEAFARVAARLGLEMSVRSAYRIMKGSVKPLEPLLETLGRAYADAQPRKKKDADLTKDFRGLKVAEEDMQDFSHALRNAFAVLAERYYLDADVQPQVVVASGEVRVTFPLSKQ